MATVQRALRDWDPIGVYQDGCVDPEGEYDTYAPQIVSLVADGCSREEVARHLNELETQEMGLNPNLSAALTAADAILGGLRRT